MINLTFHISSKDIGPAQIHAAIVTPDQNPDRFPAIWLLCIPGGTYRGLAYYDRQVPGFAPEAYSMARWFAHEGIGCVVIDNLGTGESHVPSGIAGWHLTRSVYAEPYAQLVAQIRERLGSGTLAPGVAPVETDRLFLAGVGHSLGGLLLTLLQASSGACDAIALLGWATLTLPEQLPGAPSAEEFPSLISPDGYFPPKTIREYSRELFYSPAVPPALIQADEQDATVMPAPLLECLLPRAVCEEAARIHCPIFLGFAQNADLTTQPHGEVAAYPAAHSATLFVQQGAHHCTNFEPTRGDLWRNIAFWLRREAYLAKGGDKWSSFSAA
jgi:alpha-beta hydrolase superfamily lysophospholipase